MESGYLTFLGATNRIPLRLMRTINMNESLL